jgi:hypothetical protein
MNRETLGSVVRVLGKYVEVQPIVNLLLLGQIRKYSRRDGFEWGAGGFGPRRFIEPWKEEKHAELVEKHDLLSARRDITSYLRSYAHQLTLEQVERIREILVEGLK